MTDPDCATQAIPVHTCHFSPSTRIAPAVADYTPFHPTARARTATTTMARAMMGPSIPHSTLPRNAEIELPPALFQHHHLPGRNVKHSSPTTSLSLSLAPANDKSKIFLRHAKKHRRCKRETRLDRFCCFCAVPGRGHARRQGLARGSCGLRYLGFRDMEGGGRREEGGGRMEEGGWRMEDGGHSW